MKLTRMTDWAHKHFTTLVHLIILNQCCCTFKYTYIVYHNFDPLIKLHQMARYVSSTSSQISSSSLSDGQGSYTTSPSKVHLVRWDQTSVNQFTYVCDKPKNTILAWKTKGMKNMPVWRQICITCWNAKAVHASWSAKYTYAIQDTIFATIARINNPPCYVRFAIRTYRRFCEISKWKRSLRRWKMCDYNPNW